jgi:hypothetical protein
MGSSLWAEGEAYLSCQDGGFVSVDKDYVCFVNALYLNEVY